MTGPCRWPVIVAGSMLGQRSSARPLSRVDTVQYICSEQDCLNGKIHRYRFSDIIPDNMLQSAQSAAYSLGHSCPRSEVGYGAGDIADMPAPGQGLRSARVADSPLRCMSGFSRVVHGSSLFFFPCRRLYSCPQSTGSLSMNYESRQN